MNLADELIAHIKTHGPLSVAGYMERCNAHYYASHDPFGAKGDFITAPEISQIFGELIGAWIANQWQQANWPEALLCEMGPGRGTLMKDALRATKNIAGFHDAISIYMVETSPLLRKTQQETLSGKHPRISWQETLDALPPLPLLIVANEFFDALPIEQYVKSGVKETPRKIAHNGDAFFWQPEGNVIREASPASLAIMKQIATHISKFGGGALIIDYGYTTDIHSDSLQAMRHHQFVNALENPGESDLTAHVDFAALARCAHNAGVYVHGPVDQGTFLKRLGAELRAAALCKAASPAQQEAILSGLERLVAPHQMGELFKIMAVTSSLNIPAGF